MSFPYLNVTKVFYSAAPNVRYGRAGVIFIIVLFVRKSVVW